jgi:hypothetical protein
MATPKKDYKVTYTSRLGVVKGVILKAASPDDALLKAMKTIVGRDFRNPRLVDVSTPAIKKKVVTRRAIERSEIVAVMRKPKNAYLLKKIDAFTYKLYLEYSDAADSIKSLMNKFVVKNSTYAGDTKASVTIEHKS